MYLLLLILISFDSSSWCFWPPAYKVQLKYEDVFTINEPIEQAELQDVYDEELVDDNVRDQLKVESNRDKMFVLHNTFKLKKEAVHKSQFQRKKQVYEENYPDLEEPAAAGFVDVEEKGELQKRENQKEESYDYKDLKKEFDKNVVEMKKSNDTLAYTETTTDSAAKGLLKSLVLPEANNTMNCSEITKTSSISYIECLVYDVGKPKMRNKALEKLMRIVLIWIFVYLIIAIPLWCQYGWCCCCCRCKFCRPREEIEEVKKFFVNNPVGVSHDKDGNKQEYKATAYEKYSHKKLARALESL